MRFDEKRVLVTGSSRGIGRAIAVKFSGLGARLGVHYRRDENAARRTLDALGDGGHCLLQADLEDPEAAHRLVDDFVAAMGGIDILVNCAGIFEAHPIDAVSFREWREKFDRTLAVNLLGPAHTMHAAAHHMMGQGGGRIVNVSSRGAFRGEPESPAYGASKAGLNALSQSLAQRLAPMGVFVGVVAPGFVETDMAAPKLSGPLGEGIRNQSPFGRVAKPGEVAHAVLFLASEGAEFSTGAIIDVNGASYLRS